MKRLLLITTLLGTAAFAETNPKTGEELAANQAYSYWMLDAIKSLDPDLATSVEDSDAIRSIFEGLYDEDGSGNLVPAVSGKRRKKSARW